VVLSSAVGVEADSLGSCDDLDPEEEGESETKVARKKKNKRRKGTFTVFFASACTVKSVGHGVFVRLWPQ